MPKRTLSHSGPALSLFGEPSKDDPQRQALHDLGDALNAYLAVKSPAPPGPTPDAAPAASSGSTGRPRAFWLDDRDRAILQAFGAMMFSQGVKPSDNLIVRAALRLLPQDLRFMATVKELLEQDGRKLRHQKTA